MRIKLNKAKQFLLFMVISSVVFSCSKDAEDTLKKEEQDQKVTQTELKTILETDGLSSVADNVVSELFNNKSGEKAKSNDCYEAEYTDTGFTVNFPNCSIEGSDEKLNGTLTVVYAEDGENYAFTVTYDDLMVGEIGISGTRNFGVSAGSEENAVVLNIASNMSMTMADGSVISEEGEKNIAIVFGEEFGDGMLTVDGKWTVKADGNTYAVEVTDLLTTDFGCDYIGQGLMLLNKNGLEVSVDFGDGSCDNIAAVLYPDGTEEEITIAKNK